MTRGSPHWRGDAPLPVPLATRSKDSTPAPSPAWAGYEAIGGRTARIGLILRIEITLGNIGNPR